MCKQIIITSDALNDLARVYMKLIIRTSGVRFDLSVNVVGMRNGIPPTHPYCDMFLCMHERGRIHDAYMLLVLKYKLASTIDTHGPRLILIKDVSLNLQAISLSTIIACPTPVK